MTLLRAECEQRFCGRFPPSPRLTFLPNCSLFVLMIAPTPMADRPPTTSRSCAPPTRARPRWRARAYGLAHPGTPRAASQHREDEPDRPRFVERVLAERTQGKYSNDF